MSEEEKKVFQYVQLKSLVHSDFWHKLSAIKLDVEKLDESEREIFGTFTNFNAKSCLLEFDCTAFNSDFTTARNNFYSRGFLKNLNTVESFKNCDKAQLLRLQGEDLVSDIESGRALEDPSRLVSFLLLTYADLKKYNFYYWFAFPASVEPIIHESAPSQAISDAFPEALIEGLGASYHALDQKQATFFIANRDLHITLLRDAIKADKREENLRDFDLDTTYFCFSDPSEFEYPGWSLRNYLLCLLKLCPVLHGKSMIKVLSIRRDEWGSLNASRLFFIEIPAAITLEPTAAIKWTGWERNAQGKLLPKMASMGETMDPVKIAEHFSMLNLKLMKWRLLPELDLDIIKKQKCLLFGAGTLGCAIARSLMSWGVDKITFLDYGHVSHSNPVRQSLFTHADATQNKFKATAAAERLLEILPSVTTSGHVLQIPMPGHTVGDSMRAKTIESISEIERLIVEHDVLFLVTDSRESRWLPTLLGSFYGKTVITSALGFDSYLVMRHGARRMKATAAAKVDEEIRGLRCIAGENLGCYFCNDVTAPGNSTRDRTLDQQCTVTRPGVSNIAASLAVELLVSLYQHESTNCAPAYYEMMNSKDAGASPMPEGILGVVPHSIRGYLSNYSHILPATERFSQCIACSEKVLGEYEREGVEFLLKVFDSAEHLEQVTGIAEMAEMDHDIIEDFDESD